MEKTIDKLYIMGNGFDRAHDLPTSYNHFRLWLMENRNEIFIKRFENLYPKIKCLNDKDEIIWGDLEKALGQTTVDEMIEYDKNYFDCSCQNDDTLQQGSKITAVTSTLQCLLDSWAKSINVNNVKPVFNIEQNSCFLTFNYTTVLEHVYDVPNENVLHIHNCVENSGNMIIGYHDPTVDAKYVYPIEEDKNEGLRIRTAKVEYRRYIKDTSTCIRNNNSFFQSLKNIENIYIFGHSLETVDLPYFREISNTVRDSTIWHVFIHDINSVQPDKMRDINERIRSCIGHQEIRFYDSTEFPKHNNRCNS